MPLTCEYNGYLCVSVARFVLCVFYESSTRIEYATVIKRETTICASDKINRVEIHGTENQLRTTRIHIRFYCEMALVIRLADKRWSEEKTYFL